MKLEPEFAIEKIENLSTFLKYLYLYTNKDHPIQIKNMTNIDDMWMDTNDCNLKQSNGNFIFITIQDLFRIIDNLKVTPSDILNKSVWDIIKFDVSSAMALNFHKMKE